MLPFNSSGYIRRYRVDEKSNILFFDIVGKEFLWRVAFRSARHKRLIKYTLLGVSHIDGYATVKLRLQLSPDITLTKP